MRSVLIFASVLAAIISAIGIVTPAEADIVDVTVTGTLTSGSDLDGAFFEPAGRSLVGDSFSEAVSYDTSLGTTSKSSNETYLYGGTEYGATSPILSNIIIIGNQSISVGGAALASITGSNNGSIGSFSSGITGSYVGAGPYTTVFSAVNFLDPTITPSITNPINLTSTDGQAGSEVEFQNPSSFAYYYLDVTLTSITLTDTSTLQPVQPAQGVPEPASWTTMLVGVVGLGFCARRRGNVILN